MTVEEDNARPRVTAKFVKVPLIIHTILKREDSYALQIEHLQIKRTTINLPKNVFHLRPEEISEYIKETYPTAKSFVIQYEKRGGESVPISAQLFLARKPDEH